MNPRVLAGRMRMNDPKDVFSARLNSPKWSEWIQSLRYIVPETILTRSEETKIFRGSGRWYGFGDTGDQRQVGYGGLVN